MPRNNDGLVYYKIASELNNNKINFNTPHFVVCIADCLHVEQNIKSLYKLLFTCFPGKFMISFYLLIAAKLMI